MSGRAAKCDAVQRGARHRVTARRIFGAIRALLQRVGHAHARQAGLAFRGLQARRCELARMQAVTDEPVIGPRVAAHQAFAAIGVAGAQVAAHAARAPAFACSGQHAAIERRSTIGGRRAVAGCVGLARRTRRRGRIEPGVRHDDAGIARCDRAAAIRWLTVAMARLRAGAQQQHAEPQAARQTNRC